MAVADDAMTPFIATNPGVFFFYENSGKYKCDLRCDDELECESRSGLRTLSGLLPERMGLVGVTLSSLVTARVLAAGIRGGHRGFPYSPVLPHRTWRIRVSLRRLARPFDASRGLRRKAHSPQKILPEVLAV